jgi:tRNA pseudouridine55 synthase
MGRRKSRGPEICGVLPVNKPAGMTSHDVVDAVRRIAGQRSVGHTGTLDPAATGLLVLCLGGATRFARYLSGCDKTYRALVRFGRVTDSCDGDGRTVSEYGGDLSEAVTLDKLQAALEKFRGGFSQTPPAFCARKIGGVPAYELARRGIEPELAAVDVRVSELSLERFELPDAGLEMTVSAGFYVRSLARDLGEELGVGAYLEALCRTRVGALELEAARGLDELAELGREDVAEKALLPLDMALGFLPDVRLDGSGVDHVFHGRQVELAADAIRGGRQAGAGLETVRIHDLDGTFLGVGEIDPLRGGADVLLPRRLLIDAFPEELRARPARDPE